MGMESFGMMPPQPSQGELEKPEEIPVPEPILVGKEGTPIPEKEEDFANKLSERLIGLKIDDPALPDRLIEDQKIIRAKYSLPNLESRGNVHEYERDLLEIAKQARVTIKSKSECGKFFEDYPYAGGVHFGKEKKIGVNLDRSSFESHSKSLGIFEHELIHALQAKNSPRMPIEVMEYEAYIAGGNNEYLKEHPEIVGLVFEGTIGASVRHWYSQASKERGEKVNPDWL